MRGILLAKLSVEAIRIEKRQEKVKVFVFAIVWRRSHEKQMARSRTELLRELKAASFLHLIAVKVR